VRAQLVVNKSDEFFIAIATKGVHSFVMLGNMHHGKPRILARVGKVAAQSSDSGCKIITKMVLLQTNAVLQEESIFPGGAISYAAYSINFQQYLQFTKAIGVAMGEESISCYQPLSEEIDSLTLQYRQIARVEKATEQDEHLIASTHGLSIANTCRHTAIDLIEYAQGNRLSANVSRVFFRNLPVKTTFDYGEPQDYFYVFPLPPGAYKVDGQKTAVLIKIYQRMENLLQKDPYGENTIAKFEILKSLYISQAGIAASGSLDDALANIRQWKDENQDVISQLRQQSFFGKIFTTQSGTQAMATEIEHDLLRMGAAISA